MDLGTSVAIQSCFLPRVRAQACAYVYGRVRVCHLIGPVKLCSHWLRFPFVGINILLNEVLQI